MKVEINENDPIREEFGNECFTTFCIHELIHAYIHLQCQAYPFDVSIVNKFIENLVKLFKAISFLVTNGTIQLPLVNPDP